MLTAVTDTGERLGDARSGSAEAQMSFKAISMVKDDDGARSL